MTPGDSAPANLVSNRAVEKRFVVLRHEPGEHSERSDHVHLDWMFQAESSLWTWATECRDDFSSDFQLMATRLPDHRLRYLDYEGGIGRGRGRVSQVLCGTYHLASSATMPEHGRQNDPRTIENAEEFSAQLHWLQQGVRRCAEVAIQRIRVSDAVLCEESGDAWRLRFSLCR